VCGARFGALELTGRLRNTCPLVRSFRRLRVWVTPESSWKQSA